MKKPLFLLMLCMILILCLESVCYSQYVIGRISRIPDPYWYENTHISNNGYVVWERFDGTDWEIFLYDGSSVRPLTDNSYDDDGAQINDIGYVVWEGYDGTDWEIFLHDGSSVRPLTDNSYDDRYPQINNNGYVAWLTTDGINLYDGMNITQLTDNSYDDRYPQINNNGYVAWLTTDGINLYDGMNITQITNDSDCGWQGLRINDKGYLVWSGDLDLCDGIFLYNGSEVIPLAVNRYENRDPDMNNNGQVVWIREPIEGGLTEVMLFDGTRKVQLSSNLYSLGGPKINNKGEIAWRSGSSIIVYNGVTFTELTTNSCCAENLQINDHGFVVFQRWFDSNNDIYLASRVSVISPDGGEPVPSGLPYTIKWAGPSQAVKYKVRYSMDNGLTWNKAHQEPFVTGTTLDWNVPAPPGNKRECLVNVIGFNASSTAMSRDRSDKPFTIEVLRLTSPNAGEPPFVSGEQHTITWTTNATMAPVDHIVLWYTLNNGLTWKRIDTTADSADDGSFLWTVPTVVKIKNKSKVKIVLKDAFGKTLGSDVSNGVFTIQPAPIP